MRPTPLRAYKSRHAGSIWEIAHRAIANHATLGDLFGLPARHPLAKVGLPLLGMSESKIRKVLRHIAAAGIGSEPDFKALVEMAVIREIGRLNSQLADPRPALLTSLNITQIRNFIGQFQLNLGLADFCRILDKKVFRQSLAPDQPSAVIVAPAGGEPVEIKIDVQKLQAVRGARLSPERLAEIEVATINVVLVADDDAGNVECVSFFLQMLAETTTGKGPEIIPLARWQAMPADQKAAHLAPGNLVIITAQTEAELRSLPAYIQSQEGKSVFARAFSILDYNYYEYPQLDLTGADVAKAIRGVSRSVILGMTGEKNNLPRFLAAGADLALEKPVKAPDLFLLTI